MALVVPTLLVAITAILMAVAFSHLTSLAIQGGTLACVGVVSLVIARVCGGSTTVRMDTPEVPHKARSCTFTHEGAPILPVLTKAAPTSVLTGQEALVGVMVELRMHFEGT